MAEILHNSKARRDYHILDTFEAGLVLHGSEVKSLRAGKAQIADAFARVEKGEVWLYNAHIDEYTQANRFGHLPKTPRKLLLHKSEIKKLEEFAASKGNALIPLSLFWKNGRVKVSLAVGKGKIEYDKRQDIKQREADRELQRATMRAMGRKRTDRRG